MASSSSSVSFPPLPTDWNEHTSTVDVNLWLASLAPYLAQDPPAVRLLPTVICYRQQTQKATYLRELGREHADYASYDAGTTISAGCSSLTARSAALVSSDTESAIGSGKFWHMAVVIRLGASIYLFSDSLSPAPDGSEGLRRVSHDIDGTRNLSILLGWGMARKKAWYTPMNRKGRAQFPQGLRIWATGLSQTGDERDCLPASARFLTTVWDEISPEGPRPGGRYRWEEMKL